jgi:L-cysteate sulfo-lyase
VKTLVVFKRGTRALGYAFAMQEFVDRFPSSSGGTHAGMVLGVRIFERKSKIFGISVDEPQRKLQQHVAALAMETSRRFSSRIRFLADEVPVNAEYCTAGYGVLTNPEREAIRLFAQMEGLLIDPVYTGRAAAGMIDLIRKACFKKEERFYSGTPVERLGYSRIICTGADLNLEPRRREEREDSLFLPSR